MRWSRGAMGRVPASSTVAYLVLLANARIVGSQISIRWQLSVLSRAIVSRGLGKLF